MHINKITISLSIIYIIINALFVFDLSRRLDTTEQTLVRVQEQSNTASMLLLAHVDLHGLMRNKNDIDGYDNMLPILPGRKYD
jgi:hypothetical protein